MSIGAVGCSKCDGPSQAWRDQLVAKGDTNDDGKLSLQELTALTKQKNRLSGKQSGDGVNAAGSANQRDPSTLLTALDTDGDGLLSKTELDTGTDAARTAVADAVKRHKSGHSESLRNLLFGDGKQCKADSVTGAQPKCSDDKSGASLVTDDDSDKSAGTDTNAQRLQQWMLEAFSSQFSVSNAFGQGA